MENSPIEVQFIDACYYGHAAILKTLLATHKNLNINCTDGEVEHTGLHWACENGFPDIVSLLLDHPDISVNQWNYPGNAPIHTALYSRNESSAITLLTDPRVHLNQPNGDFCTPLYLAAVNGIIKATKLLIASGNALDPGRTPEDELQEMVVRVAAQGIPEATALIEGLLKNSDKTIHEARMETGWYDGQAAQMFAIVVFLCDDFLGLRKDEDAEQTPETIRSRRFLAMMPRLPMELQMVVCHRLVGSRKDIVRTKDSTAAFRNLARIFE